jgi:hypothetical protein
VVCSFGRSGRSSSRSDYLIVVGLEKGGDSQVVKVSIEVHQGTTARFTVAVQAQSIQQARRIVQACYPEGVAKVKFPIDPESFFVEDSPAPSLHLEVA